MSSEQNNLAALKISSKIIREYLRIVMNNIIYMRGFYAHTAFESGQLYGIPFYLCTNEGFAQSFNHILVKVEEGCNDKSLVSFAFLLFEYDTEELLEMWRFTIQNETENMDHENAPAGVSGGLQPLWKIHAELRGTMLPIEQSNLFLPNMRASCFSVELLTEVRGVVPERNLAHTPNLHTKKLCKFSTGLHRVTTSVSYTRPLPLY